jgi:hypothetical protein
MEFDGLPPITVYPAPVMVAWEMLTGTLPVFVTVRLCVLLFPTETFPKLTLVELADSTPVLDPGFPEPEPALVVPTQLVRVMVVRMSARTESSVAIWREEEVLDSRPVETLAQEL